jgi:hypothetical protein
MRSGRRIFAIFCSEPNHKPQYCGCSHTALSFHTARVKSAGDDVVIVEPFSAALRKLL